MDILNLNHEKIISFDSLTDAKVEYEFNTLPILSFYIPKHLSKYFQEEAYVVHEGEWVIKEKKKVADGYDIFCKPNIDILLSKHYPTYNFNTATLSTICEDILMGTGWKLACNDVKKRTVTGEHGTPYDIFLEAIKEFKYEFTIDLKNKILIAEPLIGQDRGTFFHEELNLRDINLVTQSYDYVTRLIPKGFEDLGIESINNGIPWVEPTNKYTNKVIFKVWKDERYKDVESLKADAQKKIDSMGKVYRAYEVDVINLARLNPKYSHLAYSLGDTITLADSENQIREKQRIIGKTEYLNDRFKDTVKISDSPLSTTSISRAISEFKEIVDVKIDYLNSVVTQADGQGSNHFGVAEPANPVVGDTWWQPDPGHPGFDLVKVWTGQEWKVKLSTFDNSEVSKKVDEMVIKADEMNTLIAQNDERIADVEALTNQALEGVNGLVIDVANAIDTANKAVSDINTLSPDVAKALQDSASALSEASANGGKISTLETDINTLEGEVALKITKAEVEGLGYATTTELNAKAGEISANLSKVEGLIPTGGGVNLIDGNPSVLNKNSAAGSRNEYGFIEFPTPNVTSGTDITISFDIEMLIKTLPPSLLIYNNNNLGDKKINTKLIGLSELFPSVKIGDTIKTRISCTTTISDREPSQVKKAGRSYIEFYSFYDTSNFFNITNVKLEIGKVATPYSPSFTDLAKQKDLDVANTKITANANGITQLGTRLATEEGKSTKFTADIKSLTDGLALRYTKTETDNAVSGAVTTAKTYTDSQISVEAGKITTRLTSIEGTLGDSTKGLVLKVNQTVDTVNKHEKTLYDSSTGLQTRVNAIAGSYAIKTLGAKENILSELNLNTNGVRIKGALINLDGNVLMDSAFARKLYVDTLTTADITAHMAKFSNIIANNMDVNNLSGDKSNFVKSSWNSINSSIYIDGTGLVSYHKDGTKTVLSPDGLYTWVDGQKYRHSYLMTAMHELSLNATIDNPKIITLPPIWKGRKFDIFVSIADTLDNPGYITRFCCGYKDRDFVNGTFGIYGYCTSMGVNRPIAVRILVQQIFI